MATISNLVVKISANAKKLKSTVKSALKSVKNLSKSAARLIKKGFMKGAQAASKAMKGLAKSVFSVKSALVALASGAAFVGIFNVINNSTKAIKELSTWADVLGVSVNKLQAFSFAAKSVGFESEKVSDILKDVNDKMGDFLASGGGEVAGIFEDLGLDIKKFQGLDPIEFLVKMQDAIKGLDQTKQIFVLEAIANDASKLKPLLKDNGTLIRAMTADLKALGLELSNQQVANAAKFQVGVMKMSAIWDGFVKMLSAEVAPAFDPMFAAIEKWVKDAGGMRNIVQSIVKSVLGLGISFLQAVDKGINAFQTFFQNIKIGINGMKAQFLGIKQILLDLVPFKGAATKKAIKDTTDQIIKLAQESMKAEKAITDISKAPARFTGAIAGIKATIANVGTGGLANTANRVTENTGKWKDTVAKAAEKLEKAKKVQGDLVKQTKQLQDMSFSGSLKALSDIALRADDSNLSAGQQLGQMRLLDLGKKQFGQFDPNKAGTKAQSIEITITADEKGIITPVITAKEFEGKVTTITKNVVSKQARTNSQ